MIYQKKIKVSMATQMYNNNDKEWDGKHISDTSTQTDINFDLAANYYTNLNSQLSPTNETNQIVKFVGEKSVDLDQKCPICLGAWTDTGNHRLCSLRCGHMFGYECIQRWLNLGNKLSGKCPHCKSKASVKHIRFLYTNKLSSKDYFKLNRVEKQLKKACYKRLQIKKALMKQKQKTRKYKKMYKTCILANLVNSNFESQY